jgi:integrase
MASVCKRCRHPREEWDTCPCRWLIRRQVKGRVTYTPAGRSRAAAERALARDNGVAGETVIQAVDLWLAAKEADPGARANSIAVYRSRAKHVRAYFGDTRVSDVRPEHLVAFASHQLAAGRAPATVQGIYAVLTASLRHAQRRGVIGHLPLPISGPGIPQAQDRRHELTIAEVETVIARMPGVWGRVAELILLTGLRWGEAVAIEPGDVDGHVLHVRRTRARDGSVNAPKTRAGERVVPLTTRARVVLDGLACPVQGDYRRAREALVHALGDLHQPGMGWHTIRNAHASLLDAAGVSMRDTTARMGHGHHHAQSLAYGLATEAGDAGRLDEVRRHAAPSGSRRRGSRRSTRPRPPAR